MGVLVLVRWHRREADTSPWVRPAKLFKRASALRATPGRSHHERQ